jgi:ABC-2 type transport system permease protein
MVRWQLITMKVYLPFVVFVQLIIGVGVVYGLGFMYPSIDALSAKYITTGATMMSLATLGLVLVPQGVAQSKSQRTFEYMWSLPVPRLVFLLSDFTVWTAVVLPGVVLALVFGSVRYGFDLSLSPMVVPAFVLVALTAVSVGMSIAHLSPSPVLTGVITNVIIFSLFLFSPVNFPVERLPVGLSHIHTVLPIKYMADLVRGTVTTGLIDNLEIAFGVVGMWCVASVAALYWVFTRRR